MQVDPGNLVVLSRASQSSVLAWDCPGQLLAPRGNGAGKNGERIGRTPPQGFPGLSRVRVPSLRQVCWEELQHRGGAAGLLRPRGPGPTAVAVDGSGCPGCWPKLLSGHLLHPRKRRMGFPGRKAGQGRWPGQVALVSRFPAAVLTAHPTEPCHPLPPCNQTP